MSSAFLLFIQKEKSLYLYKVNIFVLHGSAIFQDILLVIVGCPGMCGICKLKMLFG